MFKYIYVEAKAQGMIRQANHRELIDKYSKEGWRYVGAIPSEFYGRNDIPSKFDLIFEKEISME